MRCVHAILIQCNGIPPIRNNVLIGALENIFLNPLSKVRPCVDGFGINDIFHLAGSKQILDFLTNQIFRFFLGGIAVTQQRIDFAALYLFQQRVQAFFIDAAAVFLGVVCVQFQKIVQRILRQCFIIRLHRNNTASHRRIFHVFQINVVGIRTLNAVQMVVFQIQETAVFSAVQFLAGFLNRCGG